MQAQLIPDGYAGIATDFPNLPPQFCRNKHMDITGIVFWSLVLLFVGATAFGRYLLFKKAGQPAWAGFVPFYQQYITLKIIGKPIWWLILYCLPVIGVLVAVAMMIEFAKSYGKYKLREHAAALLLPFYYFPRIGLDTQTQYLGPPEEHKHKPRKSSLREWGDAILFAVVAVLAIRTLFMEAFMIPTSSMERSLLAGDFLFVSKFHYGPRVPMVPLSVPFIHNKINVGGATFPSYLDFLELPYYRLPGLTSIERNDIVVFNFPAHDIQDLGDGAGLVEEVSMKENYIKRCVGMPGDELEVREAQVYINGEMGENPKNLQVQYQVETNGTRFNYERQLRPYGFRSGSLGSNPNLNWIEISRNFHRMSMPEHIAEEVRQMPQVLKVEPLISKEQGQHNSFTYPQIRNTNGEHFSNSVDNYGPIVIPAKGMTVDLNPANLSLYWRCIDTYEEHDLEVREERVFIDGEEVEEYTFEMDYYWMMGDNRHNSQDSRFWGFVPESHIVGTPLFVFMSYETLPGQGFFESIRWNRIGRKFLE
jgi:signal peptidase I